MRERKGFTLAELLIVVAIIGVLVAIAIPVFTSSLEKAREGVCLSNRTSLLHEIIYDGMMDESIYKDKNLNDKYTDAVIKGKGYVCPSKTGVISAVLEPITKTVIVRCSIHGQLQPSYDFGSTVAQYMSGGLQQTIVDLLKSHNNRTDLPQIDSSAPSGGNYAGGIMETLKKLTNHALGEGVTKTWSLCNVKRKGDEILNTYQVYWSGGDITGKDVKPNQQILTMYYDAAANNYEVRWMSIKQNKDTTVSGGKPYNIIDTSNTAKKETVKSGTFEDIYPAYLEEIKKNNGSEIRN